MTFLTDAAGAVTDTYDYDGWGNIVAQTGTTPNTRLYAGEEFDPELGLINLRARYYEPGRGRFGTIDAFEPGSTRSPLALNRYLYTNSDPANRRDPLGLLAGGYESLVLTGPARVVVATAVPGAGASAAAAGAVAASAGAGVTVGILVGEAASCAMQAGADEFAALAKEDVVRANPTCPYWTCECSCFIDGIDRVIQLRKYKFNPPPPPKMTVRGKGKGDTKLTAYVRCLENAEDNMMSAPWTDDHLTLDFQSCIQTKCYLGDNP